MDLPDDPEIPHTMGIAFPAGNDDFRAARNVCAQACRRFNETPEDAPPEVRSSLFLDIVRPARDRSEDHSAAITHDMTFRNPKLKAKTPFVKPPFFVDYGLRVRIGGSTFVNRGCMVMDTPVADVVIGERCNIGPNCIIVSVGHALRAEDRAAKNISIGKPITIEDGVWIGANVTVLGGVTIGEGAVIGAGSVITKSIPARTMALGVPARVVQDLSEAGVGSCDFTDTVDTLTDAMSFGRKLNAKEEMEVEKLPGYFRSQMQQSLIQWTPHKPLGGQPPDQEPIRPPPPSSRRGSEQPPPRAGWLRPEIVLGAGIGAALTIFFLGLFIAGYSMLMGDRVTIVISRQQPVF